jgi:hypothetical protein
MYPVCTNQRANRALHATGDSVVSCNGFSVDGADPWVCNFSPGFNGLESVQLHPDQRRFLVLSTGTLWIVDPEARSAEEVPGSIDALWYVPDSQDIIVSLQGLAFYRFGTTGVVWHTRRLSWDGFSDVRLTPKSIEGLAWSPLDNNWHGFTVDLETGRSTGGSFGETDSERWERLRE